MIFKNKIKTAMIFALTTAFLSVVVYYIGYAMGYDTNTAMTFALGFSLILSFSSYWFSDKIVLKSCGARETSRSENPALISIVERVSNEAKIPVPKVYIVENSTPNAFATGRNHKHSVVCVHRGLLNVLDSNELEGVIAHEISHIKNYDILLQTVASVMIGAVIILSNIWRRLIWFSPSRRRSEKSNAASVIITCIGLVFVILAPIAGQLLKMALSRNREYLADATAAKITGKPQSLANALLKISGNPTGNEPINTAIEALYISNPIKSGLSNLFSTHPPIEKRVEALLSMKEI